MDYSPDYSLRLAQDHLDELRGARQRSRRPRRRGVFPRQRRTTPRPTTESKAPAFTAPGRTQEVRPGALGCLDYSMGVRWKLWKDRLGVGPRWPW